MIGSRPHQFILERRHPPSAERVQMLVDGSDTVLPELSLPLLRRKRILEHTLVAVKRHHLASLFLHGHLREQVFDARVDVGVRVLINVLFPVFVEVNPFLVIHAPVLRHIRFRNVKRVHLRTAYRSAGKETIKDLFSHAILKFYVNIDWFMP